MSSSPPRPLPISIPSRRVIRYPWIAVDESLVGLLIPTCLHRSSLPLVIPLPISSLIRSSPFLVFLYSFPLRIFKANMTSLSIYRALLQARYLRCRTSHLCLYTSHLGLRTASTSTTAVNVHTLSQPESLPARSSMIWWDYVCSSSITGH